MQRVEWKHELRLLGLLLVLALLIGSALQMIAWSLFFASSLYLLRIFRQFYAIECWLRSVDGQLPSPPVLPGLLGHVLDSFYRIQRLHGAELKDLQDSVKYLKDSFGALNDAVVMIDTNGDIEWCNDSASRLLGLRYPQDVGQLFINLLRNPQFIHYFDARDYQVPHEMNSPIDSERHLQCQITFFGEGSRLLFARDITHTHRLQEMRKDFVGNVSHELRTPLTVINGYLGTLADSALSTDKRWSRAIQQMLQQVGRMESLVKDLIALSKLEAVPEVVEQQAVQLKPLLLHIREEVLSVFEDGRDIRINCDDQLAIAGNPQELRSAFTNLIMNAAKYSDEGGEIEVDCSLDQQHLLVAIKDNGIGIDSHHLPRLTERFYRVDKSRSTHTGGTGLGLAIVKHVLLHHQAELLVTSSLDVGSCFTCKFPSERVVKYAA